MFDIVPYRYTDYTYFDRNLYKFNLQFYIAERDMEKYYGYFILSNLIVLNVCHIIYFYS